MAGTSELAGECRTGADANTDPDGAIDAAQRIGDDDIQGRLGGGTVDPDSFTHGTSAQRKKWLTTGYTTGDPTRYDTFRSNDLG